jgi:propionyl-CoA carboxylase alpha subunit
MNTRLQVEHPVTELVTGIDLVEAMIRSAAGEPLGLVQTDVHLKGWAIEGRVCAENPSRDFLPSSGRLATYRPPPEGHHDAITIRHDSGVIEGSEISVHYDPMIGKLIAHASDRAAAVTALSDTLEQFVIEGVEHNLLFLGALMRNARFRSGALSTGIIEAEYPLGFIAPALNEEDAERMAAVAACLDHVMRARQALISGRLEPAPLIGGSQARSVRLDRKRFDLIVEDGDEGLVIRFDESVRVYVCRSDWGPGMLLWNGTIDEEPAHVQVRRKGGAFQLTWHGMIVTAYVSSRREADLAVFMPTRRDESVMRGLRSPMPALVKAVLVRPGQAVRAGDTLCIIEAMKMETSLRAERDGTIMRIHVTEGASVGIDAPILDFV